MRNIVWTIALFVLFVIQGGILLPLHITLVNLVLIVVAMAAILSDFSQGLIVTLIAGVMLDFIAGSPDGLISASLIVAYLILRLVLTEILSREPNWIILATSVAASTIVFFLTYLLLGKLLFFVDTGYVLRHQMPLTLVWNLIFAYPIYLFYLFVQNLVSKLPSNEEPIRT